MVVGWRGIHTPAHMYRAILEGIAFELHLQTLGVEKILAEKETNYRFPTSFILFGGGSKSPLWRQILADITGKQILLSPVVEATALGAGILAGVGAGWFPDLSSAINQMTRSPNRVIDPDNRNHSIYQRLFEEVYSHLFPAVQTALDRLTELTEE
jgi:xylulokinase